jgi:hypothetical protein
MTTTHAKPTETPDTDVSGRRLSPLQMILGAVLILAVIGAAWLMLKPSAAPSAGTTPTAGVVANPTHLVKQDPVAAFSQSGSAACATMNDGIAALGDFPSGTQAQATFLQKRLALQAQALASLKKLQAPTVLAAQLQRVFALEVAMETLEAKAVKALNAGDGTTADPLLAKINASTNPLSAAYQAAGLPTCGS